MEIQDSLLTKVDEHLPFAGHVTGIPDHIDRIENPVTVILMRTQEVIVSDP